MKIPIIPFILNNAATNHGSKQMDQNMASTLYMYIKGGLNKQHACSCEFMTYLTYLAAS